MEEKTVLEDLLDVKKDVDQMDLLEFKSQWEERTKDYTNLAYTDRLKFTVMSIKILQAKVDLIRTISSVRELTNHPEPKRAIYYYLRAHLWKFLDNFRYILLVDDISDRVKLDCMDLLDELADIIARDEQLKTSSVTRLNKLLGQIQLLENTTMLQRYGIPTRPIHEQLDRRVSRLIETLEPKPDERELPPPIDLPAHVDKILTLYASFSITRISIEKSGVSSIIQLLHAHPEDSLEEHRSQIQETLAFLERQVLLKPTVRPLRNQCAYALVILLEMLKMHKGLPVLLLKILRLCAYIQTPPPGVDLDQELQGLKSRITMISQKKLRPIIEDVLWKNPEYFVRLPQLPRVCPWCYTASTKYKPDIIHIQRVVAASFDHLVTAGQTSTNQYETGTSPLSKTIIEILGLLVNIEPSPNFLKTHTQDALLLKQAKDEIKTRSNLKEFLDQQYKTYTHHLKFLQESLNYYQGILNSLKT